MLLRHRGLKPADRIRKDMVEALQAGLGRQGRIKPATRAGELAVNVMAGSERRNELTSFIVPRGTSFHRWVELDFLLLHLNLHRFSNRCDFPAPPELGAVKPQRCMTTAN